MNISCVSNSYVGVKIMRISGLSQQQYQQNRPSFGSFAGQIATENSPLQILEILSHNNMETANVTRVSKGVRDFFVKCTDFLAEQSLLGRLEKRYGTKKVKLTDIDNPIIRPPKSKSNKAKGKKRH